MQLISGLEALEARQLLSLTVDLRLVGGGKQITVDHVGQVVQLEAWAVVTGQNSTISDDGLQSLVGSFLSGNVGGVGSVRGDLTASPVSPFTAQASQDAVQRDLDGDGDLDAGSNDDVNASSGFFVARAGSVIKAGAPAPGGGVQFKVADVTFTATSLLNGSKTNLNFRPRNLPDGFVALWQEDGVATLRNAQNGTILTGSPVVVVSTGTTAQTGSISGIVFNDANQNGVRDAGETEAGNASVFLDTNQNGQRDFDEPFSSFGDYSFTGLAPGTYHVALQKDFDHVQVFPIGANYAITIAAGENRANVNFAVSTVGFIRGVVYNDANHNGKRDAGEAGVPSRQVYVDANHDGVREDDESIAGVTDTQGNYILKLLPGGQYDVRVRAPSNDVAYTPRSRFISLFTAPSHTTAEGQDFGESSLAGAITGVVRNENNLSIQGMRLWIDDDNDNVLDPGEQTVLTGAAGDYHFNNLAPGTYTVRIVLPSPYAPISPASGKYDVTIAGTHELLTRDFKVSTFSPPTTGIIAGTVYNDANSSGVRDASEQGLANWGVYLDANKNALFDKGERTLFTDSNGNFSFVGLPAGTYRLRELLYADYRRVTPDAGYYDITLAGGQAVSGKLFGNTRLGFIKGNVFKDTNGNGKRDAGEVGLASFRVFDDTDGDGIHDPTERSTLTDGNGNYTLNVPPGSHTIRVQAKAGYRWSGILYYKVMTGFSTRVYDRNFGEKPIV